MPTRSHDSSTRSRIHSAPPDLVLLMARGNGNGGGGEARKRNLDEMERRLQGVEDAHTGLKTRLDNVELCLELETSYKFLRVESSSGLHALFQEVEAGTCPKSEIRAQAGQALAREVREVLERETDEGQLKAKSDELSNSRRRWPTAAERTATLDSWQLERVVEWVSKQGQGYSVRLRQGEPSRLCHEQVQKCLNWSLFVYSKLAPQGASHLQVYPDRGPKQRSKGKGGKGNGRAAGRGNKGGKGNKGRGGAAPPP